MVFISLKERKICQDRLAKRPVEKSNEKIIKYQRKSCWLSIPKYTKVHSAHLLLVFHQCWDSKNSNSSGVSLRGKYSYEGLCRQGSRMCTDHKQSHHCTAHYLHTQHGIPGWFGMGGTLKLMLFQLLPWAGTLHTRLCCSKPHSTWPGTLPGVGCPSTITHVSKVPSPRSHGCTFGI